MDTASGAFMASDTTAFAPANPETAQRIWRAGATSCDYCETELVDRDW